jgi:hypothetical protein
VLVAAVALLGLATSACRVDVSVGIDADDHGGGEVRVAALLDADAVNQLVGSQAGSPGAVDPATRIKVDDLVAAGWDVEGPTKQEDGGLEVVATHPYEDAAEGGRLIAEVGGDPGPFRDIDLRQERGFFTTTTHFRGTVDLAAGLAAFTDPDLRAALQASEGAPLGVTTEQLEQRLGGALNRLFGLQVAVRLPGDVESNAPTETDNGAVWAPSLGERVVLEASSERWNVANIVFLAVAVVAAAALVVVLVRRRRGGDDPLTVTDSNVTVGNDGATGPD